ncbi:unnamed protein product [Cyprideis torosa]|uniref:Mitochondrial potassium channel ATP-binding subunit n=1 Tax=Cyprideis torosa TaxID=163714 RepID=A0A7R8W3S7_9CRUS|nr:unnamed protein product [Cyprideis torosa]CAG0883364.1 unnamed protein product [Cyprideis torosa]
MSLLCRTFPRLSVRSFYSSFLLRTCVRKSSLQTWNSSSQFGKTCMRKNLGGVLQLSVGISGSCGLLWFTFGRRAECLKKDFYQKHRSAQISATTNSDHSMSIREFLSMVWKYIIKEHWILIFAATMSALVVAYCSIVIPGMLGELVDVVAKAYREGENHTLGNWWESCQKTVFSLMKMYGIQSAFTYLYISLLSSFGERSATTLRMSLFNSLLQQEVQFFDSHRTGELVNRLTNDVQELKSSLKLVISQGLRSVTQCIGCFVWLWTVSPPLTTFLGVTVPSLIGVGTFLGAGLRALSKQAQEKTSEACAVAEEALANIRLVRSFAMEHLEQEEFAQRAAEAQRKQESLGQGIGAFQGLTNAALNGVVLATLVYGGQLIWDGKLAAGDLMSFLVSTQTLQRSLSQFSLLFGSLVRGFTSGQRVFEFIERKPLYPLKGGTQIESSFLKGDVEFKNVTFSYPSRPDEVVLQNFNLRLYPGRVLALCGPSGAGKSTVVGLLEGFYRVENGRITVDDHDITELDPSWLRREVVGYISQEPLLFNATIRENIRYGRPDATDAEVEEAAQRAHIMEFASTFEKGLDTKVGERGVGISGGQKQRIAIARALIKDPHVLLLDEATSALDSESQEIVQRYLADASKGRTTLIIAHRLSTIRQADQIAVMVKGRIVEHGTHDSLMREKGVYYGMVQQERAAGDYIPDKLEEALLIPPSEKVGGASVSPPPA